MRSAQEYDRDLASRYALAILANGQMPSDEMLALAGISNHDAQKLMAQLMVEETGGGGGGSSSKSGSGKEYKAYDGKYYEVDKNGKLNQVDASKVKDSDTVDWTVQNQLDHRRKNRGK